MNRIEKICDGVVQKYAHQPNVLGIVLFGSAARKKFDEFSDIDIYILLKKKGAWTRANFVKNNIRVDVIFDTFAEAESFLRQDKWGVKRIMSHMLAHGKVLYQKDASVTKLITIAKANLTGKTRYSRKEVLMHKYSIDDFWGEVQRDFKNKDAIAFGLDSELLLGNVIDLFLKMRGSFWVQPNQMRSLLSKLDKNFAQNVQQFYAAENMKTKQKALQRLIMIVFKNSGGPLPKKWTVK